MHLYLLYLLFLQLSNDEHDVNKEKAAISNTATYLYPDLKNNVMQLK